MTPTNDLDDLRIRGDNPASPFTLLGWTDRQPKCQQCCEQRWTTYHYAGQQMCTPCARTLRDTLLAHADNDMQAQYWKDPAYDFRAAEGAKHLQNSAAARGLGVSATTEEALQQYAQDVMREYQKALQNVRTK